MQEDLATYNAVMTEVGQALMAAGSQLLAPGNVAQLDFEGEADEFGQYLCETMALYGASHLHCIGGPDKKVLFLQQVRSVCPSPHPCIHSSGTLQLPTYALDPFTCASRNRLCSARVNCQVYHAP